MPDSAATVESFNFKQMVEQESAPSAPLPMIVPTFSGAGLQDLTPGTAFNQVAMATFVITIAGTGSPNTFDWTKTGGSGSSSATGVSITGSAQTLDDGFQITFGATTGHTAGNAWTIKCKPRARLYWDSAGLIMQIWSNGSTSAGGGTTISGTATSGNIPIGDGSAWVSRAMSGDITISSTGVTAIGATKVTNAMLAGSIAAAKLIGSDIATVGTITSGTWNGGVVAGQYGGTGVNNGSSTITLAGNLVTSGANSVTLTSTGATNVTLPTTGTLATLAGSESLTNKTFTNSITSTLGTITSSTPAFTNTATWNSGGVTFTNLFSNITDSASAAASLLIDLQVGSSSKFKVTKAGLGYLTNGVLLGATSLATAGDKLEANGILYTNAEDSGLIVSAAGGRSVGIIKTLGLNTEIRYDTAAQLAVRRAITGGIISISTSDTPMIWDTSGNTLVGNDLKLSTVTKGIYLKEGTNATMGSATLSGGTITVNTTKVTANSRIFITSNADGGTPGFVRVSARSAGTSFTITSSSGTDTSTVSWLIVEPA